jgi:hypothetical protein
MIQFLQKLAVFLTKTPIFSPKFLAKIFLKIITSVPGCEYELKFKRLPTDKVAGCFDRPWCQFTLSIKITLDIAFVALDGLKMDNGNLKKTFLIKFALNKNNKNGQLTP